MGDKTNEWPENPWEIPTLTGKSIGKIECKSPYLLVRKWYVNTWTGWWFGTWLLFSMIYGIYNPSH